MHNGQQRRIVSQHPKVLDRTAPFWRGETAEHIIADRVRTYEAERATRRAVHSNRSRPKAGSNAASATLVPKTLRRLEWALTRRKTLAARQRVQARIDQLKQELGR